MIEIYGLKNCDTCRKALKWLDANEVPHSFHDIRQAKLDADTLSNWLDRVGLDSLLNRRGMTWRSLPDIEKQYADDEGAISIMMKHRAVIKRPVFVLESDVKAGFDQAVQTAIITSSRSSRS